MPVPRSLRFAQLEVFAFTAGSALQYAVSPSASLGVLLIVLNVALGAALRRRVS